jgi:microcystin degradation protein MlrC
MRKIAFAELHQETNSFSPILTTLREFKGFALYYGDEISDFLRRYQFGTQAQGFFNALEKEGNGEFTSVPLFTAWAFSGGPLQREVYDHFKTYLIEALLADPEIEGLYLSLHGAMGVEGMTDPETDLLQSLRAVKGKNFPIGVSFDLHANVTRGNVESATFILGYRTNPHRDHTRVGYRATHLLIRTLRGEVKPVMAFRKMPLLKGGGWGIDFIPPMRGIFRHMKKMEKRSGVLSVSNFWVHIWLDDPEMGWSTVVITDDNLPLAQTFADELADKNWAVRNRKHPEPKTIDQAIAIALKARLRRKLGTVVFCDVSDIVGAGAPGENTWILKGLMEQCPDLISYVPVRDAESAAHAFEAGVGATVNLQIGGKLLPHLCPTIPYSGEVIHTIEGYWGKTAIVRFKGVHVLLTELAFPGYFSEDYFSLGLNLWRADITVVKNLFPFRYRFLRYNRKTVNVATQGITSIDVHQLPYTCIPRPIFPLDAIESWRSTFPR